MQYEIFRDLLVVIGAVGAVIAAIVGGLGFFALRALLMRDISAVIKKRVDDQCRKIAGQTDIQAGVTYWTQQMYNHAIEVTDRAITQCGDVLDEPQMLYAKSNLAFYYAESHKKQPSWHLKHEAIAHAKLAFERYSPSIATLRKPDWIDNYLFVRVAFLESSQEREEVLKLIDDMLKRSDLQSVHDYLRQSRDEAVKHQQEL